MGMGTGATDGPEVGRAERRPGLKNTGPSAGRVGALGGSPETRRNSNFDRLASFKIPPLFSTSATFFPVREDYPRVPVGPTGLGSQPVATHGGGSIRTAPPRHD